MSLFNGSAESNTNTGYRLENVWIADNEVQEQNGHGRVDDETNEGDDMA